MFSRANGESCDNGWEKRRKGRRVCGNNKRRGQGQQPRTRARGTMMTTTIETEGKARLPKTLSWLIYPISKEPSTWALHGPGSLYLTYSNRRYGHQHTSNETQRQRDSLPEEKLAKSQVYIPTFQHVTQTQKHSEVQQSKNKGSPAHRIQYICKETRRLQANKHKDSSSRIYSSNSCHKYTG